MSLPDVCPLDDKQCKRKECHLYCVEWRTQEPLCLIGYRSTAKTETGKTRVRDTYAEKTFKKLGKYPGQQTVPAGEKEDEKTAEKRRKFKPWPEFPVKRTEKAPEESLDEKLRAWDAARHEKTERSGETGKSGEAPGNGETEKAPLRPEAHLKGEPAEEKALPVKKPPVFKERVVSKDIHATLFSSVSEQEKPRARPSDRKNPSGRKDDEEQEKRRKVNKVMELDLPDEYEEEFWS